jgi:heparan-alpha-glucosaminide N-acetyltransferase
MDGIQLRRPNGAASPVISEESPLLLNSTSRENIFDDDDKKHVPKADERLVSLDFFRGLTIWFMMLVNNSGGSYAILEHAPWDGLTIADFVMPFFLFIVGVSIALVLHKQRKEARFQVWKKVAVRTIKLFLLGLMLQGGGFPSYDLASLRIMGILQRIAFGYFFVSTIAIFLPRRNFQNENLIVLGRYMFHFLVALAVLTVYLLVLFLVQVPGCEGRGHLDAVCNAEGYIDSLILGESHLYSHPTCLDWDPPCKHFDPEGLVSTWASSLSVFIGLYYGYTIIHKKSHVKRIKHWLIPALAFMGIGLTLHFTGAIPLNKNLYSLSYIMVTAGSAGILLSASYVMIDVLKWRVIFWPWIWEGMNSIILFVADELVTPILGGRDGDALFYWKESTTNLGSWIYKTIFLANAKEDDPATYVVPNFFWGFTHACLFIIVAFFLFTANFFVRL